MNPLAWYKQYCKLVDDERIRLIAFEDRWHYVALNCCKGQGIMDNTPDPELLRRKLAVKLGLQLRELEALALRLAELDLLDSETFQPLDWDKLQVPSANSTPRVQKHRARMRQHAEEEKKKSQVSERKTDETPMKRFRNGLETETDKETDLEIETTTDELDWTYLGGFDDQDRGVVVGELEVVKSKKRQDVLDELAGALRKGAIKGLWANWLISVCSNAAHGDFKLRYGLDIGKDRARRAREAQEAAARKEASDRAAERAKDPQERQKRQARNAAIAAEVSRI